MPAMASPAAAAASSAAGQPTASSSSSAALSPLVSEAIASLVTVVITTSPTPSAPCTDLLSAVLASFRAHCPALLACPVTVVFDTYDRIVPRARLKKGSVTAEEARCYATYKDNVRQLVEEVWAVPAGAKYSQADGLAEYGSPFIADNSVAFRISHTSDGRVSFVEPAARLGFGLAVRTAVRAAATPYVWIQQHDWTLAADIPLAAMLDVMQTSEAQMAQQAEEAASRAMQDEEEKKEEVPRGKDQRSDDEASRSDLASDLSFDSDSDSDSDLFSEPEQEKAVPIRYICLPSIRMLRYASSAHVLDFPSLRSLTTSLKRNFLATSSTENTADVTSASAAFCRVPLTPLFFWHDKTHIASTSHYLQRVFPSRLAVGRGDFIEDHIGQRARSQMKHDSSMWFKWACWQYYPEDGNQLCLRHLQGRTWRGEDKEREMRDLYQERNRSAASAAAHAAKKAAAAAVAAAATAAPPASGSPGANDDTSPFQAMMGLLDDEEP